MNPRGPANDRSRNIRRPRGAAALLVLAAGCAGGCASPLGGRDLDLTVSAQALPGAGAGVALAQRLFDRGERRVDFELGLERQELADEGDDGDDWSRLSAGLRCAASEPSSQLVGRAGVTWLRTEGDAQGLEPGDFGGLYGGLGWSFEVAPALAMGPDLAVLLVDSEGNSAGSGAVVELAWRFTWHL